MVCSLGLEEEEAAFLIKMKKNYMKQLEEKEEEIKGLKFLIKIIDYYLSSKSFVTAKEKLKTGEGLRGGEKLVKKGIGKKREVIDLVSSDGSHLGVVTVDEGSIEIVPDKDYEFGVNTSPFSVFFVRKVLLGMKLMDENARVRGELNKKDVLDFKIEEIDNKLKRVLITNYRDPKRINQIVRAAKWTLETMLKKRER